jgi:hypothetical protein
MNAIHNRHVALVPCPGLQQFRGLDYQGWAPCIRWCEQQFGDDRGGWWYISEGVFEFTDERDCLMFLLRWA